MFRVGGDVYIAGIEHRKLKCIMQTHLTHLNTTLEYFHASVILDNLDVLYLEGQNVFRSVLKNKTSTVTVFFLKKPFLI